MQASTLTFFLTCPFEQLTKKSTCQTQFSSCPNKLIKIIKTREKLSAICVKCFGYCLANIISPVINNTNRLYDNDIFNRQIKIQLEVRHKVIRIKRCHHHMSV